MVNNETNGLVILVLRGGPIAEREVSFAGAGEVVKALREWGHKVVISDIYPDDLGGLDIEGVDVVFPVLHGPFGEDGQLQRILDQRKLRYVGSDAKSSQLAMDKYASKGVFQQGQITTPPSILIKQRKPNETAWKLPEIMDLLSKQRVVQQVGLPCIVKPNCQGSSIGVMFAQNEGELAEIIVDELAQYGDCLIEKLVVGREITVGIVADELLPVMEIKPAQGFYDYRAKYERDDTEYIFDLDIPGEQLKAIQQRAWRAFELLGCRDMGRVDFILDGRGEAHILEINTIPGLTTHSLLPKAAAKVGVSMAQMCAKIVQLALARPI